MTQPKSKEPKPFLPDIQHCSEAILLAAIIAKLTAQKGEQCIRIGSSDVLKALQVLRKHAAAARRENSKGVISFDLKISSARGVTVTLHLAGVDALAYFSRNLGTLAPMVMKACERVNNSHFEKDANGLVGQIKVGQLQPGKAIKLSVKGNLINLC